MSEHMNKPMNLYLPVKYKRGDGSEGSEFHKVGVAWPLKNETGLQLEIRIPLVLGGRHSKLVAMYPRQQEREEEPPTAGDDIPY